MDFQTQFYVNFIKDDRYLLLVRGLGVTVQVSFLAVLLGVALGLVASLMKLSTFKIGKRKPLEIIANFYTTIIRGTPVVVQLLIIYNVIFASVNVSKVLVAVVAFGINSGAYVTEIIRSGILSIDVGQEEAARSLGLSRAQAMRHIILPQAVKNILPSLGNEFIALIKETSVVGYIAMDDLTRAGNFIQSRTYSPFLPLIAVALIYLVMVLALTQLLNYLERRLRKGDTRTQSA